tara:strand:+ start:1109 stop:1828 length:720 start_codon:yes stop_codon:yes gene_type:complete
MVDAIFCVSLERMEERRKNVIEILSKMDFAPVYVFDAIDGMVLDWEDFYASGFYEYKNNKTDQNWTYFPVINKKVIFKFWNRPVTKGEMGCSISHYLIWKKAYEMGFSEILVLEDDIEIKNNNWINVFSDFKNEYDYDLFYLGGSCYDWDSFTKYVNRVFFKYTTHAYIIKSEAIRILLNSNYTSNMIVIDEFLTTCYDEHPRKDLRNLYNIERKLKAYSIKEDAIVQLDQGGSQTEPI